MRCLAIDVGNTSAAVGVVAGRRVSGVTHIKGGVNSFDKVVGTLRELTLRYKIDGVVLCSVVPADKRRWIKILRRHTGLDPLVVSYRTPMGIKIDYPKPATIGPDRLANACGAVALYGAPVIVADFGTALTFDVVDAGGAYIGGVICPGLPLMTDYLADRTELLPLIGLKGRCERVGRSTESAMRIGAHIGYRGMVREIVGYLQDGISGGNVALCATGGYAKWVLRGSDMAFKVLPNLTLFGLGQIFEKNTKEEKCRKIVTR